MRVTLEIIDSLSYQSTYYNIDVYNSAYNCVSEMRFLMLHNVKNEEGIKTFFQEMYEIYTKVITLGRDPNSRFCNCPM